MFPCPLPLPSLPGCCSLLGRGAWKNSPSPSSPSIPSIKAACFSSPKSPLGLGQRGAGSATKACSCSAAACERLFLPCSYYSGSRAP